MMQPTTEALVWIKRRQMVATYITNSFRLYLAPGGDFNNAKNLAAARAFASDAAAQFSYGRRRHNLRMNYDAAERAAYKIGSFKGNTSPCVSPDGRNIFFASARSGSVKSVRMNATGTMQISTDKREGGYPKFRLSRSEVDIFRFVTCTINSGSIPTRRSHEIQVSDETSLANGIFS